MTAAANGATDPGIDQEPNGNGQRVAAALAVKYEKVLPYFASSDARPSEKQTIDPNTGLEFAYGFIEKFVQVAFQVPRAKGQ